MMSSKGSAIAGHMYYASMFFLLAAVGFGAAFIALSMSSRFFEWEVSDCVAKGVNVDGTNIFEYNLDMRANIGWNRFTVSFLDEGAAEEGGCFGDLVQGETYPLEDFQVRGLLSFVYLETSTSIYFAIHQCVLITEKSSSSFFFCFFGKRTPLCKKVVARYCCTCTCGRICMCIKTAAADDDDDLVVMYVRWCISRKQPAAANAGAVCTSTTCLVIRVVPRYQSETETCLSRSSNACLLV